MNTLQRAIDALNGISDPSPELARYIAQSVAHFKIEVKSDEDLTAWGVRLDAMQVAWDALAPAEQAQVNRLLNMVRS